MRLLPLLLALLCCSCGYQFEEEGFAARYQTLSIPFVEGDWDGRLTATLIEQLGRGSRFTYCRSGGAALLKVTLVDFTDKNIGFRYDRDRSGHLRHSIIPTETRLTGEIEVTLLDAASGTPLAGPARLTASVDFDHDYESPLHSINIFSLGQLNDYDAAYEAAYRPLNRLLAEKIVDFLETQF